MKHSSKSLVTIDGGEGEGGGQVLRTALTLSSLTGQPVSLTQIRANRRKPGLLRQHLTAVQAAQQIASATVTGAELGSQNLTFVPSTLRGGSYNFAIGTAGSTMLVLQTILLPLCFADKPSEVILEGGTHNPLAPPFEFLQSAFLPILHSMGAGVEMTLERPGFYPAGGGRVKLAVRPCKSLSPINLLERGLPTTRKVVAIVNNLPSLIGERELKIAAKQPYLLDAAMELRTQSSGTGPGNVFLVTLGYENISEVIAGFGEVGKPAEAIAQTVCSAAKRYLTTNAPVGDYLADQLLLPFAVAGSGSFRCTALTSHFKTNTDIIQKFLPISIQAEREDRLAWKITFNTHQP